jgi:hypothetical protein
MKSIYQKLAITSASAVLGLAIVMGSSPSLADSSYTFTVTDHDGDILVSGTFSGKDSNRNGWIDSNEVTDFSDQMRLNFGSTIEGELPLIPHRLQHLKPGSFRFAIAKWRKGDMYLEFETLSNDVKVGEARIGVPSHFAGHCVLKQGGKEGDFFSAAGDGTQGLVWSMTEAKKLNLSIKKS